MNFSKRISNIRKNVRVKDVMSDEVLTVKKDSSILAAMKKMSKHDYSAVVVAEGDRPLGIFTERDLLNRVLLKKQKSSAAVSTIMSRKVQTVDAGTPILKAAERMKSQKIKKLVVMEDDRMVGIITQTDIIKSLNIIYQNYGAILWNPWLSLALFLIVTLIIVLVYLR